MKIWGIVATVLLVASLCLNVWYYTETTNINASINEQLGYGYYSEYQLPFTTMSEIRSNITELVRENEELQQTVAEYQQLVEQYEDTLDQIRQEAEWAQMYGTWEQLLNFILTYLW
jgi:uncharacterized membrane protein YccC